MEKDNKELINFSENDILEMMNDTSQLIAQFKIDELSSAAIVAQGSSALTNDVEFWKWMGRNYSKSGILIIIKLCNNILIKE